MISPQSHNKPRAERKSRPRKHLNKKFYNSTKWRQTRKNFIQEYQKSVFNDVAKGYWTTRTGTELPLYPHQQSYILSLPYVPCEQCLKLYCVEAYDTIEEGKELDHIDPLNPENALEMEGYGNPFNKDNLQLLCMRHHARKSQRERT